MTINEVKKMLASQLNIDEKKIEDNSRLVEDLGADSLDMIEMLMTLEEKFGVIIPDDKTADLKTVLDIANYIDETKKGK
ncbi:MAG: acyl carrier protein [Clostridia bacterium]|nr:acyl carrier protein [Clostridia bacterium]